MEPPVGLRSLRWTNNTMPIQQEEEEGEVIDKEFVALVVFLVWFVFIVVGSCRQCDKDYKQGDKKVKEDYPNWKLSRRD